MIALWTPQGTLLGRSIGYKACPSELFQQAIQGYRFLNNEMYYDEQQISALLAGLTDTEMVISPNMYRNINNIFLFLRNIELLAPILICKNTPSQDARRAFFEETLLHRRRDHRIWQKTPVGIAFKVKSEFVLMKR